MKRKLQKVDTRREYETYGLEYINSNDGNYSPNFLPLHNNECSPVKSEIYHGKPSQQGCSFNFLQIISYFALELESFWI